MRFCVRSYINRNALQSIRELLQILLEFVEIDQKSWSFYLADFTSHSAKHFSAKRNIHDTNQAFLHWRGEEAEANKVPVPRRRERQFRAESTWFSEEGKENLV